MHSPNGNLHTKGQMAAWPFSRLWKVRDPTLFQMTLVASLLVAVYGDCDPPPNLSFAFPINVRNETHFRTGTILRYNCRLGYGRNRLNPTLTCNNEGKWNYGEFCSKKRCSNPGDLPNGQVEINTGYAFGSKIEYSCLEGYILIGSTTSYCDIQGNGVGWSDPAPECIIVKCLPPPNIKNGKHSGGDEDVYNYGSSVTYTCDPQFSLLGKASISCTVENKTEGVWSPSPPTCEKIICPQPTVSDGSIVSGFRSTYNYKDSVVFTCKKGYILSGSSLIYCEVDKNWHPSPPTCELNGCPGLPDIPHAFWVTRGYHMLSEEDVYDVGTVLQYRCKAGYRSTTNKPTTLTCQKDFTWSPFKGCEAICCSEPPLEPNEIIASTRANVNNSCVYTYGDRISFVCYGEHSTATCTEDGMWSPRTPKCVPGCHLPPKIDHGHSKKSGSFWNIQYTYECDIGYTLVGEAKISCDDSGWSPPAPQCKALCLSPDITNGKLSVEKIHYIEPETVTVQCNSGYGLVGFQNITCSENRSWHPKVPKCEWEVPEGCEKVLAGKHLMQCLPKPEEVKLALELYKLSLETELLELKRDKAKNCPVEPSFPKEEKTALSPATESREVQTSNLTAILPP
ncbi:C4b-binding protein alpha chain [Choloepus didactylus]|uniref:C4b-binding protein alpha chain n=1 Tax=Choloepus didactylus TaxID=27675 RepID=UPI00189DCFD1|nr:C4b-binding protein alpha chain [Choloepus didactylus]XP_037680760.1 C4b-binding protein alpha chain [Choloepus didactylus]XP_037680761.1 C4b-binding protein alpha chain [Choloepus didactylus]